MLYVSIEALGVRRRRRVSRFWCGSGDARAKGRSMIGQKIPSSKFYFVNPLIMLRTETWILTFALQQTDTARLKHDVDLEVHSADGV